jgi:hypothetical protein
MVNGEQPKVWLAPIEATGCPFALMPSNIITIAIRTSLDIKIAI